VEAAVVVGGLQVVVSLQVVAVGLEVLPANGGRDNANMRTVKHT
jgi:hypothetical protein